MSQRTGAAQITAITIFCPWCQEAWDTPSGSQMLAWGDDGAGELHKGQRVRCYCCDGEFKLPAAVERLGKMI